MSVILNIYKDVCFEWYLILYLINEYQFVVLFEEKCPICSFVCFGHRGIPFSVSSCLF